MSFIGPALPPHLMPSKSEKSEDEVEHAKDDDKQEEDEGPNLYGPALPPGFSGGSSSSGPSQPRIIGPTLPPGLSLGQADDDESSEEEEVVGPMPIPANVDVAAYMQDQLVSRANRMKSKLIDQGKEGKIERESWMIDLPKNRTGLIGLEARSFRKNAGPDKNADTSAWTDTPEDKLKKAQGLIPEEPINSAVELEDIAMRERDKHMAKRAAKHASKRTAESLVDLHQKELNKKKKAEAEKKPMRQMFDREKDLQVNRFDEAQKRAVLKKANLLDDRFSAGNQKFL